MDAICEEQQGNYFASSEICESRECIETAIMCLEDAKAHQPNKEALDLITEYMSGLRRLAHHLGVLELELDEEVKEGQREFENSQQSLNACLTDYERTPLSVINQHLLRA